MPFDLPVDDALRLLLERLAGISLPLVAYPWDGQMLDGTPSGLPISYATGFLAQRGDGHFLITAAHAVEDGQWFIEVPAEFGPQPSSPAVLLPVGEPRVLRGWLDTSTMESGPVDFAWSRFEPKQVLADLDPAPGPIQLPIYRGPMDGVPAEAEVYAFVAMNRPESFPGPERGTTMLARSECWEAGMTFVGRERGGNYRFALDRPHQGHSYYAGASGAPIAASSGEVVSVLLGGKPASNELVGAPLASFEKLIGVIE